MEAFEQAFSAYIGVRHAIRLGNGTQALDLGLRACEVGPGDLVFTPEPVHLQPAYNRRLGGQGSLPVTECIATEILSLPMYPQLNNEQISRVAREIKSWAMADD